MTLLKLIWYFSAIASIIFILFSNPKSNSLGFNTNRGKNDNILLYSNFIITVYLIKVLFFKLYSTYYI
uniref:Preprotein translocase subunit G n=1 Tax=Porphyridium sordidum TaxID=28024 RepID=A0A1C9CDQ0_PORSO|nr:preprotein translocase subunit G [Porphyridium sordidum]AOM66518.1 preprotein translocase subunit G [Porphyridium sordidum]